MSFRESLDTMQRTIHELAKSKGWWDSPRSSLEIHMLIVSEVAEATEEARKPNNPEPRDEGIELADAVIRILDYCEYRGWSLAQMIEDKHLVNTQRTYRHGGKLF